MVELSVDLTQPWRKGLIGLLNVVVIRGIQDVGMQDALWAAEEQQPGLPQPLADDGLQELAGGNLPQELAVVVGEYGIGVAPRPARGGRHRLGSWASREPSRGENMPGVTPLLPGARQPQRTAAGVGLFYYRRGQGFKGAQS